MGSVSSPAAHHALVTCLSTVALVCMAAHVVARQQPGAATQPQSPPSATARPEAPQPAQAPTQSETSVADDRAALASLWTSGRYRITAGDVIEFDFPYVPEFNQTVPVQPDGYISLRGIQDVPAAGRTVPQLKADVIDAYQQILRDPVVTLVLKEFEKPYFIIGGDVTHPGKYELRGAVTLTQALAVAGGKTASGKLSDVVLFRRYGNDLVDVKRIDVKRMFAKRDLSEDPILRPGDTIFVPRSAFSKIEAFLPKPSAGFFLNPLSW